MDDKELLVSILTNKIESYDYRDENLSMKTKLENFNNCNTITQAGGYGLQIILFGDLYNKITLTASHIDHKYDDNYFCDYDYDYLMKHESWGPCEIEIINNDKDTEHNRNFITNMINNQLEIIAQLLIKYSEVKDIWKVFPDITCKGYNFTKALKINEQIPIAGSYLDVEVVPMVLFVFTKLSVKDLLELVKNN